MTLPKISALIILALILSACSLIGKTSDKIITITYWGLFDSATTMNQIINDYKKIKPNVNIFYEKKSREQYRESLEAQIKSGKGPDIFQFHNTWTLMLDDELNSVPNNVISPKEFKDTYYPVASFDLRNKDKKLIGIPLSIDGLALYYNEELFQAAGITAPPATWQQFSQTAAKLTVKDTAGNIRTAGAAIGTSTNVDNFSDILAVMILQNGGDPKSPTTQKSADALDYFVRFASGQNRVWDQTQPRSTLSFSSGTTAMIFGSSSKAAEIKNTNPLLKFKVAPIPQLEGSRVAWASYWALGVSAQIKDKKKLEEAWNFIKYLNQDQILIKIYSEESKDSARLIGMPYPKVNLAQKLASDPFVGAYVTDAPFMRSFPLASGTFDNGLNDKIVKSYDEAVKAVLGGTPANRALEKVSKDVQNILTQFTTKTK